jgi:hypothetical protein
MTKKKIKMLLYGEPGVGKSVFASQFPNPFFLTTDGNYEWLEDFGAKPEAHHRVDSWADFVDYINNNDFDGYDTIVVDLLEDLFKWNEYEFVQKNRLEHISDAGYGKGYDITRNNFFIEITKLLNKDKHVVLLMHEVVITTKDRRGVEKHSYKPSSRLPDKVLDMIEGRLRFVLRAYFQDVDINGRLVQKRMLSLIPKSNEYGIIRGVNTDALPEDIPLSVAEFFNVLNNYKVEFKRDKVTLVEPKQEENVDETPKRSRRGKSTQEVKEETTEVIADTKEKVEVETKHVEIKEEKDEVVKTETTAEPISKEDKLAAIKAKLAAIKAGRK